MSFEDSQRPCKPKQRLLWLTQARAWHAEPDDEHAESEIARELGFEGSRDPEAALAKAKAYLETNITVLNEATSLEVAIYRPALAEPVQGGSEFKLTESAQSQTYRLMPLTPEPEAVVKDMARNATPYSGIGVNYRFQNWGMWIKGKTIYVLRPLAI